MSDDLTTLVTRFDEVAKEAQTLAFLPRGLELQEAAAGSTETFLAELSLAKAEAVAAADEEGANTILAMELALRTALLYLKMWIASKKDAGESAWGYLVDAQLACTAAIRVRRQLKSSPPTQGLENFLSVLDFIEHSVFPPQVFNSIGGIVGERECSICHAAYDFCPHVKGRAYMGEICHTILKEISLREVSIVEVPANKHARITHFSDGSKMRNKMTWRLEDREPQPMDIRP